MEQEALEADEVAARANSELLEQIKEGVARAPVLTGALLTRTKELLEKADDAADKKKGTFK